MKSPLKFKFSHLTNIENKCFQNREKILKIYKKETKVKKFRT